MYVYIYIYIYVYIHSMCINKQTSNNKEDMIIIMKRVNTIPLIRIIRMKTYNCSHCSSNNHDNRKIRYTS